MHPRQRIGITARGSICRPNLHVAPVVPYFGLRSYQDAGQHYEGQIGSEATPAEFLDALLAATREMVRVLKPSGSIFVNLGDKYSGGSSGESNLANHPSHSRGGMELHKTKRAAVAGMRTKSLIGLPWRYAIRCIDELGLILRAEIIWAKPNGLPESVTDRVRRSHEQWFHFTKQPRYFSAVDEIREELAGEFLSSGVRNPRHRYADGKMPSHSAGILGPSSPQRKDGGTLVGEARNPLGKLPGSVWTIPTQPLTVPEHLGIDHFAAYPMEWPRRIIQGWTPTGICTVCGEDRRPISQIGNVSTQATTNPGKWSVGDIGPSNGRHRLNPHFRSEVSITGYMCGCPTPTAPTRPAVVLDPFGGTGTTALVAKALGRTGISIDLSHDYTRLAQWRVNDPQQLATALQVEKPDIIPDGQLSLFEELT